MDKDNSNLLYYTKECGNKVDILIIYNPDLAISTRGGTWAPKHDDYFKGTSPKKQQASLQLRDVKKKKERE